MHVRMRLQIIQVRPHFDSTSTTSVGVTFLTSGADARQNDLVDVVVTISNSICRILLKSEAFFPIIFCEVFHQPRVTCLGLCFLICRGWIAALVDAYAVLAGQLARGG